MARSNIKRSNGNSPTTDRTTHMSLNSDSSHPSLPDRDPILSEERREQNLIERRNEDRAWAFIALLLFHLIVGRVMRDFRSDVTQLLHLLPLALNIFAFYVLGAKHQSAFLHVLELILALPATILRARWETGRYKSGDLKWLQTSFGISVILFLYVFGRKVVSLEAIWTGIKCFTYEIFSTYDFSTSLASGPAFSCCYAAPQVVQPVDPKSWWAFWGWRGEVCIEQRGNLIQTRDGHLQTNLAT